MAQRIRNVNGNPGVMTPTTGGGATVTIAGVTRWYSAGQVRKFIRTDDSKGTR